MSENFNKKCNAGSIVLASPYFEYVYSLPLVSFGDAKGSVELGIVYNSQLASSNLFNIANGFKLNLQKKLIFNNGKVSHIIDSNGLQIACNEATNGANNYGQRAYALNDESHRILRQTEDGYELEYPDYSKELFNANGDIVSSYDKYGVQILDFGYSTGTTPVLTTITYRPALGATYKKLTLSYNENDFISIAYSALKEDGTDYFSLIAVVSFFTDGVRIYHYSNVEYLIYKEGSEFIATASTGINNLSVDVSEVKCTETENKYVVQSLEYGKVKDSVTYEARQMTTDGTELLVLDQTDFHGVITRVQYKDHMPTYSYEMLADESAMFNAQEKYIGTVQVQEKRGVSGAVIHGLGRSFICTLPTMDMRVRIFPDDTPSSVYTGEAVLTGWIRSSEVTNYTLYVKEVPHQIQIDCINTWLFFAIPYFNDERYIDLRRTFSNPVELCGTAVYMLDRHLRRDTASVVNFDSMVGYNFDDVTFMNEIDGQPDVSGCVASFEDIQRYFIARKKGRTNEFYYNNGRSLITNADTIKIRVVFVDNEGSTHYQYALLSQFSEIAKSTSFQTDNRTVRYIFNYAQHFMVEERPIGTTQKTLVYHYDSYLDLVSAISRTQTLGAPIEIPLESYTRNSLGLVTSHTQGADIVRSYTYDNNCTCIQYETDEFGAVTNYTTDAVWGQIVAADVSTLAKSNAEYTADGKDLEVATFGVGTNTTSNTVTYADGNVSTVKSGGITYGFGYTDNDLTAISKNGVTLKSISYDTNNYRTATVTSPTSANVSYVKTRTVDNYGRELLVAGYRENTYALYPSFDSTGAHVNLGDGKGSNRLSRTKDLTNNRETLFGTLNATQQKTVTMSGTTTVDATVVTQDVSGRPTSRVYARGDALSIQESMTYATGVQTWETDSRILSHQYKIGEQDVVSTAISYDDLKRPTQKTHTVNSIPFRKTLTYNRSRVRSVIDSKDTSTVAHTSYVYNSLGRIFSETENVSGKTTTYKYDILGRLTRENNQALNKTYRYTYDAAGNVTQKQTYAYTTVVTLPETAETTETFAYDSVHPDRLSAYNGTSLTYDQQGCPTSLNGKTLTWTKGKLTRVSSTNAQGTTTYSFTYDGYGRRVNKAYNFVRSFSAPLVPDAVRSESTDFVYDHAGRLVQETKTRTLFNNASSQYVVTYLYDEFSIVGMSYNGVDYYFQRNLQGDVVGVYDNTGTKVVTFQYDAYGNCTASGGSLLNFCHIRYRGYYYDAETELYWVTTRYYSPALCRWISPDSIEYLDPERINGLNLYAYCGNDPVNYVDPSGNLPFFILTAIIGAVIGVGITAAVDYIPDKEFNLHWGWYVGAGALGAAIGAGIGMAVSYYATGSIASSTGNVFASLFKSTSLYRSVGPDELADLKAIGKFRQGPNSMEGKFFANSKKGAMKWGESFSQSSYIKIRVPKSSLSNVSVNAMKHLDAIDDAFYFSDLGYLNSIAGKIWFL
ncbi:MAG: RHS repeat-associated core domain-containing protein [Clostridia bacterium]|nr:RHS repeat-associated core domain-containing protein [Clostridia bacterium]